MNVNEGDRLFGDIRGLGGKTVRDKGRKGRGKADLVLRERV